MSVNYPSLFSVPTFRLSDFDCSDCSDFLPESDNTSLSSQIGLNDLFDHAEFSDHPEELVDNAETSGVLQYFEFDDSEVDHSPSVLAQGSDDENSLSSGEDRAALNLSGMSSAKRHCTVEARSDTEDDDQFFAAVLSSMRASPSTPTVAAPLQNRINIRRLPRFYVRNAKMMLALSMQLRNELPPNIESMGLSTQEIGNLRSSAGLKQLVSINELVPGADSVTLEISELYDRTIHRYVANCKSTDLPTQSSSCRRFWRKNTEQQLAGKISQVIVVGISCLRIFEGIRSPTNVFHYLERHGLERLGELLREAVESFLRDARMSEGDLVTTVLGKDQHLLWRLKGPHERFLQLVS